MNLIVDIAILAIIIICIIAGYKKGLVGMAFSVASFIVAAIIALILFNPVASFIMNKTELDETIQNVIIENFTEETGQQKEAENMPDMIMNYIEERTNEVKNIGVEAAAVSLSQLSIKALSFIGLFIVAKIILAFFSKLANLIASLPILKQFNKAGGLLIGILKGLIIVYIILAILLLVMPFFGNLGVYEAINESFIGNIMYNNNILLKIIF